MPPLKREKNKRSIYEVQLPVGYCPACGKEIVADLDFEKAAKAAKGIEKNSLQVCPICGRDF